MPASAWKKKRAERRKGGGGGGGGASGGRRTLRPAQVCRLGASRTPSGSFTSLGSLSIFFFFNDTATTEIYTLSLHDALPIWQLRAPRRAEHRRARPTP